MALEMINPYSKYELKRRPTYDEIAGLIGENETLTGSLPDRRATFLKQVLKVASLMAFEVLKEQQNRIQERQMRELLLRHNLGGGTVHVERMRQQSRDTTPIEAETPRDDNVNNASIQAQLQERARMAQEREQQGQAHQSLLSRSATPVIDIIFGGLSRTSSRVGTPMAQPVPQLAIDFTQDNPQAEDEVEMMTAREEREAPEPKQAVLRTISYRLNVGTMSAEALKFQLFLRGFDVDDPENELPTRAKGKGGGKTTKQPFCRC